eukprot:412861-Karenia_brevis.AAC.1
MVHVKGHAGNIYNECADKLAEKGSYLTHDNIVCETDNRNTFLDGEELHTCCQPASSLPAAVPCSSPTTCLPLDVPDDVMSLNFVFDIDPQK